jgi:hypothetical protein
MLSLDEPKPSVVSEETPKMCTANYPFTLDEVRRLTTYRAAVKASFYTDWPPAGDTEALASCSANAVDAASISNASW